MLKRYEVRVKKGKKDDLIAVRETLENALFQAHVMNGMICYQDKTGNLIPVTNEIFYVKIIWVE